MQRLKFLWMYANYLCTIEWLCVYLMMCCVNVQCNAMPCSALSTVPSGPPREVRAVPGGAGSVRVTWTHPPGGASGYVIFYSPSSPMADHTLSVQVDDPEATSHTIQSMMTQTEYTIQMLAYAELSTALSDSTTVYLDGKCIIHSICYFRQQLNVQVITPGVVYSVHVYVYTCICLGIILTGPMWFHCLHTPSLARQQVV